MCLAISYSCVYFFFNVTATTEIYTYRHTLSLHDALPISRDVLCYYGNKRTPYMDTRYGLGLVYDDRLIAVGGAGVNVYGDSLFIKQLQDVRSEEHTSELQSLMRISYAVFC